MRYSLHSLHTSLAILWRRSHLKPLQTSLATFRPLRRQGHRPLHLSSNLVSLEHLIARWKRHYLERIISVDVGAQKMNDAAPSWTLNRIKMSLLIIHFLSKAEKPMRKILYSTKIIRAMKLSILVRLGNLCSRLRLGGGISKEVDGIT